MHDGPKIRLAKLPSSVGSKKRVEFDFSVADSMSILCIFSERLVKLGRRASVSAAAVGK